MGLGSAHRPKKRFGQHFLIDGSIIDAIVQAIDPKPHQSLIEIGPGQGVLTRPLIERAGRLTVIEIDRDLVAQLPERLGALSSGLTIINQDVLRYPFVGDGLRVVGNLPYNISTPLLFHLFDHLDAITDMHFMLQKEVVMRLVAEPNSKDYGRLSVMAQFYAKMSHLFDVSPSAFDPPPKVDSSVIRLLPRRLDQDAHALAPVLSLITRHAFGQRRKTLRNALSQVMDVDLIESVGVSPKDRAEALDLDAFVALAKTYASRQT
jgi:16S rRNA (adenine1518-N6/adenine1519-N6)-dimethyltransferase